MNKAFVSFCLIFIYSILVSAQDKKPVRFNLKTGYSAGLLFMPAAHYEHQNHLFLTNNMPPGSFYEEHTFKPTFIQNITIGTTPFRNKKWYLNFNFFWCKNQTTSFGYTVVDANTIYKKTSTEYYSIYGFGWGIAREIPLKKWGKITARITFLALTGGTEGNSTSFVALSKSTGQTLGQGYLNGGPTNGGLLILNFSPYFLLDNPVAGLDYSHKIYKGLEVNAGYSYWFYGSIKKYYKYSFYQSRDYGGHYITLGLSYTLYK